MGPVYPESDPKYFGSGTRFQTIYPDPDLFFNTKTNPILEYVTLKFALVFASILAPLVNILLLKNI